VHIFLTHKFVFLPPEKPKAASMELSKNYIPGPIEEGWYAHWLEKGYFNSYPDDRQSFTIVIPPPNVTGVLHMGHTLNETVQDILVRRARMSGFNACWVPGSDHASIATEARVVQMLKEKGIEKKQLTREEFLKYAYEWKEKYGGIIYHQIAKLGCSVDWNRVSFTMDPEYSKAVIKVFVDLHKKGLIYRENRMVNWDPKAKTALSDEEVIYREVQGKLYYIQYKIQDSKETITVATVRPETILGDTAICVNPDDERYKHLYGKHALVPLINRPIRIITDVYVDKEFGTGALKVTPAHDKNDYELGLKHGLPVIDIMNDDGTLNPFTREYEGLERFEARKKIVADLENGGYLLKTEDYIHQIGFSERTNEIIEPALRIQWWVNVKSIAEPALREVMNDKIKLHPSKFKNLYRHWMENIRDWCISRHLWWGQQIPAWYDKENRLVVAENETEALYEYERKYGKVITINDLVRDEDVLDTWFSSWLWPIQVFKGITDPGNKDCAYYYPSSVLVTGQDIIFLWVARMAMAGMEWLHERPFDDVYFTGMVRDKQGRKMSKSLGNSPDLLILIEKYGADAVRFGILISAPAGNDLLFDEGSLEQGRNFNNKLWNALKLVQGWKLRTVVNEPRVPGQGAGEDFAVIWFENRLNEVRTGIDKQFKEFRLSEALKTIYSLIWDDFCSWYLEWVKPGFGQPIENHILDRTVEFFDKLLQLLHPFMPFITEEIYHLLKTRTKGDDLVIRQFSRADVFDRNILESGSRLRDLIQTLKELRKQIQVKNIEKIHPKLKTENPSAYIPFLDLAMKQTNSGSMELIDKPIDGALSGIIGNDILYLPVPDSMSAILISKEVQTERLLKLKEELEYLKGLLKSIKQKLNNERFVQNAKPELIEYEQKKKMDTETKIHALEESLSHTQ
jgi:valyl-tRNA synthetase